MSKTLLETLYYNLPKNFRNADIDQRMQLKRYLDILVEGGFGPLHAETKDILKLTEFDKIPVDYIPLLAADISFRFPKDLDEITKRTYIKNAVTSYRMKGTKKALLFMLRELTKFQVDVNASEEDKTLTVTVEVESNRQDLEHLRDQVYFIIEEYAPPYRELKLINVFTWEELFSTRHMRDDLGDTYLFHYASHDDEKALYFNKRSLATLNDPSYNLSNFQQYDRKRISYTANQQLVTDLQTDELVRNMEDNFGQGSHTNMQTWNKQEFKRSKKSRREDARMVISDIGIGRFMFHKAIILNVENYEPNRKDRGLGNIKLIDTQEQFYKSIERITYTVIESTKSNFYDEEYYEPPIKYLLIKSSISMNPIGESYSKPTNTEQKVDKVAIISTINELFMFVLSEKLSTTQSNKHHVSGTIERWMKEKYAIIGKENQSTFTPEETYANLEKQDDHTDIIKRKN